VRTKRYDEDRARSNLERTGLATYLPKVSRRPRPAVGSAVAPMFPGYVFVQADTPQKQRRVMRTPGVADVVRGGDGEPATVPNTVIEVLQQREGPDGLIGTLPGESDRRGSSRAQSVLQEFSELIEDDGKSAKHDSSLAKRRSDCENTPYRSTKLQRVG